MPSNVAPSFVALHLLYFLIFNCSWNLCLNVYVEVNVNPNTSYRGGYKKGSSVQLLIVKKMESF